MRAPACCGSASSRLKRAFAVEDEGDASVTAPTPLAIEAAQPILIGAEAGERPAGAALLQRQDRGAVDRRRRGLGFLAPHGVDGDRGHRSQRAARQAGQPADAGDEGRGLDRRRARLEARAASLRRDPFPRRRPARLRLDRQLQLHRAEGPEERRLRHAAGLRHAPRHHPVLRAARDSASRRRRSSISPRPSPIRSTPTSRAACSTTPSASGSPTGRPRPTIPTTTRTTASRPTTIIATARAWPIPRGCGRCSPGGRTSSRYSTTRGSGLRHLPADSHLTSWLDRMGVDFDVDHRPRPRPRGQGAARALQGRADRRASGVPHRQHARRAAELHR